MISYTCKTAVKAVIYLASRSDRPEKASIREIAEHIDANGHTVGKVMQTLVKQGIIKSTKGPSGGFFITEQQQQQSLMRIVEAIDGSQLLTGCGLGLTECSGDHPCPIHDQYKVARDILVDIFSGNTVKDFRRSVSTGHTYLLG
jgi:Rrf2 family protein